MSTRRQTVASEGWLNVIESVFSGMARAIIHNSDYRPVEDAQTAIVRRMKCSQVGDERIDTPFQRMMHVQDAVGPRTGAGEHFARRRSHVVLQAAGDASAHMDLQYRNRNQEVAVDDGL